jgi:hypothetical protein
MTLGQCIVAEVMCNSYLCDINICSLSGKKPSMPILMKLRKWFPDVFEFEFEVKGASMPKVIMVEETRGMIILHTYYSFPS